MAPPSDGNSGWFRIMPFIGGQHYSRFRRAELRTN